MRTTRARMQRGRVPGAPPVQPQPCRPGVHAALQAPQPHSPHHGSTPTCMRAANQREKLQAAPAHPVPHPPPHPSYTRGACVSRASGRPHLHHSPAPTAQHELCHAHMIMRGTPGLTPGPHPPAPAWPWARPHAWPPTWFISGLTPGSHPPAPAWPWVRPHPVHTSTHTGFTPGSHPPA